MRREELTAHDLRRELLDWRDRYPRLTDAELFLAWFLHAFVTEDEGEAVQSLTGGPGDKDVDAIFFDENVKTVFVVQGKYRKEILKGAESRNEVKGFAELALDLCGDEEMFSSRLKGTSPKVAQTLQSARKRLLRNGYRLVLYYVTTGRVSQSLRDGAQDIVRRQGDMASIEVFDGRQVLLLLKDYLDGVAPPVGLLDLKVEATVGISCRDPLRRIDKNTDIESWVFSMTCDAVSEMFEQAGPRLFARNVRGFLGSTEINRSMKSTLKEKPEFFWYYNNGITIVCDQIERITKGGTDILRVTYPQVINGQQTTRVLHTSKRNGRGASVLVRVFRVPRRPQDKSNGFDTFISNIVRATNWQNAIKSSDLVTNDRRQVEIERRLRKVGYLYIRKRQTKGEAKHLAAAAYSYLLKKEEVAQAVAACNLDPVVVREGKENLFEKRWYSLVFPTGDVNFYLNRYWLMRHVSRLARGYPERAYAKWLVTNFLWKRLQKHVASRAGSQMFRDQSERDGTLIQALDRGIDIAFRRALGLYRARRGKGVRAIDVSTFFKRRNLDRDFSRFWDGQRNKLRARFRRTWKRFERTFKVLLET
jgi:hypothetical protein